MCYEQRFFKSWAKRKTQQREEVAREAQSARSDSQPIRPPPAPELTHRKKVRRELEEIA